MAEDLRTTLTALLPRLRRFGIALTGSAADADDLVQDACARVLERAAQLREEGRADAWIYGIMRHLWIDRVRAGRLRRHEDVQDRTDLVGEDGARVTEARLTLAGVRRCLLALAEEHRTVLTLVCIDGLSYREAADILDVPIGTVMSRMARARLALHQRLQGSVARAGPAEVVALTSMRARPANGGAA